MVTRRRSGFNEYPESMFEIKNTLYALVILYKSGIKGGIHCLDMFSWCDFISLRPSLITKKI